MALTEFCCRNGGNNLNAGSVDGTSTEPATTPLVTYANGGWDATTDVFTAAGGSVMTEAVVGRFASLSHDADTNPTTNQFLVARITAVNAGSRTVTLSTTARALFGTEVATAASGRTLRIGGAWKGPNAAIGFPFNFATGPLVNAALDPPRVNFKNDATYAITAAMTHTLSGPVYFQGYTTSYGDLGKATIDGGTSGASYVLLTASSNGLDRTYLVDLIFQNNGATGTASGITGFTDSRSVPFRCVVNNVRGSGFDQGNAYECEAYACNKSNTTNLGGFTPGASNVLYRCISHHNNAGANCHGFYSQAATTTYIQCISASNSGSGFHGNNVSTVRLLACEAYANALDGVRHLSGASTYYIENCNFINNVNYGINISTGTARGFLLNCGFVGNFLAPTSNTGTMQETGTVTYGASQTPWVDPANGDFSINHASARNAGRARFTQTYTSWSAPNTVGYPDIGAAQAQDMSVQPTYGVGI